MKAGTKLAIYGAGLLATFGAAYGLAGVVVPESVVTSWMEQADGHDGFYYAKLIKIAAAPRG